MRNFGKNPRADFGFIIFLRDDKDIVPYGLQTAAACS